MQRKRNREVNYRYNIMYPDGKFPPRDLSYYMGIKKHNMTHNIWFVLRPFLQGHNETSPVLKQGEVML